MSILASVVLNRAATTLLDPTNVNYSAAELLDYLNAGITAIVANKPDAAATYANFVVTNGQAKQTIPSDGVQLLEVTRNVSSASTPIRQIETNHLNHADPSWPNRPLSGIQEIQHFMVDSRNPLDFYIYPQPVTGTNTIEILYLKQPTRLTLASQTLPVADIYENALHHFVCAYAYAKNSKRTDLQKASMYFELFSNAIGARTEIQYRFNPVTPKEMPGANQAMVGGPAE